MYSYRVTKYNPKYRNKDGIYTLDEWTSISDFNNEDLTRKYTPYEDAYINAIYEFMKINDIKNLYIDEIEIDYENIKCSNINLDIKQLTNNRVLSKNEISDVTKALLREIIYAKLKSDDKMEVHFGYDYYMYILSKKKVIGNSFLFNDVKLYIEEFKSPYSIERF